MTKAVDNKAYTLEAFDTLFNKRDYKAAEKFWSPYIQHSAHIAPGRDGLFNLVKAAPAELRYENALIVANGDYVMLHGRCSGIGRPVCSPMSATTLAARKAWAHRKPSRVSGVRNQPSSSMSRSA